MKYKDALAQSEIYDELFKRFNRHLDSRGLIVNEGKIIDTSNVIASRQRNTAKSAEGRKHLVFDDVALARKSKRVFFPLALHNTAYNMSRLMQIRAITQIQP